jgi:PadR family transcriptional regulator, regulatory protein PadR
MDPSQLLKGVLDLAVLAVLRTGDGYGYDVLRRLRAAGLEDVGDASVYGTLRRLFNAGALTSYVVPSEEGPHRKYYGLNAAGRDQLARSEKTWRSFADTMGHLLDTAEAAA